MVYLHPMTQNSEVNFAVLLVDKLYALPESKLDCSETSRRINQSWMLKKKGERTGQDVRELSLHRRLAKGTGCSMLIHTLRCISDRL
jgi:hypothetical protein